MELEALKAHAQIGIHYQLTVSLFLENKLLGSVSRKSFKFFAVRYGQNDLGIIFSIGSAYADKTLKEVFGEHPSAIRQKS